MKRPIGIIILVVLLAALVYSQRHAFFRSIADEVKQQMGPDSTAALVQTALDSGSSQPLPPPNPVAAARAMRWALAFYESGALDSAAVHFTEARSLDWSDPAPCRYLAVLRARQGRPGDALRELEEAVVRDSTDAEVWIDLGKIRSQLGDEPGTRAAWGKALKVDPGNGTAAGLLELMEADREVDTEIGSPAGAAMDTVGSG